MSYENALQIASLSAKSFLRFVTDLGVSARTPFASAAASFGRTSGTGFPNISTRSLVVGMNGISNGYPGVVQLPIGLIVCIYCEGVTSIDVADVVKMTTSSDAVTWSSPVTIYTPASGNGVSDSEIILLSNGNVLLSVSEVDVATQNTRTQQLLLGLVHGSSISWNASISMPKPSGENRCLSTTKPLQLSDGSILFPFYSSPAPSVNPYKIWYTRSSNFASGGSTFTTPVLLVASDMTGQQYVEPLAFQAPGTDTINFLMRMFPIGNSCLGYTLIATDDLVNFTTPVQVLRNHNPGRASVISLGAGLGMLLASRKALGLSGCLLGLCLSSDGVSWSSYASVPATGSVGSKYQSLCALHDGSFALLYSEAPGDGTSNIYFYRLTV